MHRELAFNFHGNRLFPSFSELLTCNSAQSHTTFHMKMTIFLASKFIVRLHLPNVFPYKCCAPGLTGTLK